MDLSAEMYLARCVLPTRAEVLIGWGLLGLQDPQVLKAHQVADLPDQQEHKEMQDQQDPLVQPAQLGPQDLPALRARTEALEALVRLGQLDPPALAVLLGLKGPQDLPGLRDRLAAVGQLVRQAPPVQEVPPVLPAPPAQAAPPDQQEVAE